MDKKIEVAVAMSGGVDSSVAAALLVEQGYAVRGIMLKLWDGNPNLHEGKKRFEDSLDQAQGVAQQLGIPFEVIDVSGVFKQKIVGYFIQSHQSGKTPNPCFVCNRQIKWGLLMDEAQQQGAEYLATGHYARVVNTGSGKYELRKSLDQKKDQSYVLAGLTQKQLSRAILPLGTKTKNETREIAHSYNFDNYDRQDSQDLCFLGTLDQEAFLALYAQAGLTKGEIHNLLGEVIGEHNGLANYTIGQRKGLGAGFKEPMYVLSKDVQRNVLIAGTSRDLGTREIKIADVNWISGEEPDLPKSCSVKIRYKAAPVNGRIKKGADNEFSFIFTEKVRDATPGQYAVFYDDDLVIGSGMIQEIFGEEL